MKTNKTSHTNDSALRENHFYPRHESSRADALVDELDEVQILRLYGELKTRTETEWKSWFVNQRVLIGQYDCLTATKRRHRLQALADTETLCLHHACIVLELWRVWMDKNCMCLPPRGPEIHSELSHRDMMQQVLAAWCDLDRRAYWPLDHPDIDDGYPFLREDS